MSRSSSGASLMAAVSSPRRRAAAPSGGRAPRPDQLVVRRRAAAASATDCLDEPGRELARVLHPGIILCASANPCRPAKLAVAGSSHPPLPNLVRPRAPRRSSSVRQQVTAVALPTVVGVDEQVDPREVTVVPLAELDVGHRHGSPSTRASKCRSGLPSQPCGTSIARRCAVSGGRNGVHGAAALRTSRLASTASASSASYSSKRSALCTCMSTGCAGRVRGVDPFLASGRATGPRPRKRLC